MKASPLRNRSGLARGTFHLAGSLALIFWTGCGRRPPASTPSAAPANSSSALAAPRYTYDVVRVFPHHPGAFTQGLVFLDGALLESTGLIGLSSLRRVDLETGKVLRQIALPSECFAEGLAVIRNEIFQVTWQNGKGFVYDLESLRLKREFNYSGEGCGLTTDGESLILSDGTSKLRFLDPITFALKRAVTVADHGQPVGRLNELEYVKGEVLANVWPTDCVVRIDPATGVLRGIINFAGLLEPQDYHGQIDVFNGIAYHARADRLFVTGKRWPKLFEVRLKRM